MEDPVNWTIMLDLRDCLYQLLRFVSGSEFLFHQMSKIFGLLQMSGHLKKWPSGYNQEHRGEH